MDHHIRQGIAANEDAFRDVNEAIARGQWPGEEDVPVSFRCECAQLGCNAIIELSVREYERVRAHPRRFVLAPGHELPEVERVVRREPGYFVVEKLGEVGREAQALEDSI